MKKPDLQIHILEKLDHVVEQIAHIRESQIRTEADVRHHIKRTDLLEKMVLELKKIIDWLAAPIYLIRWVLKAIGLLKK